MSRKLKVRSAGEVRGLLRGFGRVALWSAVGLLLLRGATAVVAVPVASDGGPRFTSSGERRAADAFAIHFARVYLADPSSAALRPMLAPGASIGARGAPAPTPPSVEQATVTASRELGAGASIVTVACELRGGEARYLAIPLLEDAAGRVAALGLPAAVPAPPVSRLEAEPTQLLGGADAEEIATLVGHFLPAYVTAASATEYAYLLAPGAAITPLGGDFAPLGAPGVRQFESGEGRRRRVLATIRLRAGDGGVYPVAYRLDLIRRDRWYVAAVEGVSR